MVSLPILPESSSTPSLFHSIVLNGQMAAHNATALMVPSRTVPQSATTASSLGASQFASNTPLMSDFHHRTACTGKMVAVAVAMSEWLKHNICRASADRHSSDQFTTSSWVHVEHKVAMVVMVIAWGKDNAHLLQFNIVSARLSSHNIPVFMVNLVTVKTSLKPRWHKQLPPIIWVLWAHIVTTHQRLQEYCPLPTRLSMLTCLVIRVKPWLRKKQPSRIWLLPTPPWQALATWTHTCTKWNNKEVWSMACNTESNMEVNMVIITTHTTPTLMVMEMFMEELMEPMEPIQEQLCHNLHMSATLIQMLLQSLLMVKMLPMSCQQERSPVSSSVPLLDSPFWLPSCISAWTQEADLEECLHNSKCHKCRHMGLTTTWLKCLTVATQWNEWKITS